MLGRRTSTWIRRIFCAVVAVLALTLATRALAEPSCKQTTGKFTLQPLAPSACASPVGVCSRGTISGNLAGTIAFTGTSLITTVDSPTTGVAVMTGDNRITTPDGVLVTKDAIVLRNGGAGDFAEVITIMGGTGKWIGATGYINATGIFDFAHGGTGTSTGEICTP
jgi:hypothetical protein